MPFAGGNSDHIAGSTLPALLADPHQHATATYVEHFLPIVQVYRTGIHRGQPAHREQ